jgi:hypothetical protein
VGVYFSDTTRNYGPKKYIASYRGMLLLLLQAHIQFQIVTPRTLSALPGNTLLLPDVRVLSDAPTSQSGIRAMVPAGWGTRMHVLPFLGTESLVTGKFSGTKTLFRLPPVERGAVVWFGSNLRTNRSHSSSRGSSSR